MNELTLQKEQSAVQLTVPQTPDQAMLTMIERVCTDTNFDMAKMEKLVEMRNQELARIARIEFSADYARMAPNLPTVAKTKRNDHTKSWYAALEDINQRINPILREYGFATSTRVVSQTNEEVTVEAILWHKSGHTESTQLTLPLDNKGAQGSVNKTVVHATASSITYAKRVAICALLNISTGTDNDGNGADDRLVSEVQAGIISEKIQKCNDKTKEWFTEKYNGAVNVPAKHFDSLVQKLNNIIETSKASGEENAN